MGVRERHSGLEKVVPRLPSGSGGQLGPLALHTPGAQSLVTATARPTLLNLPFWEPHFDVFSG